VYAREVAGGADLLLVSLTESFADFDPAGVDSLPIAWTAPVYQSVRLRSYSLRRKLYFRMDSRRSAGDTSYQWPTNLLRALRLSRSDIGVVAWVVLPVGETTRDVYVPVRIRGKGDSAPPRRLEMMLLPAAELTEVFVSLATVRADGGVGTYLQRDQPLGHGFYPAERGIRIPLPAVKASGTYLVEIGATLREGGAVTTRFWLHHVG
jgi:hypothetical protein